MGLILTRSPHLIKRGNLDEGANLRLEIGKYQEAESGFEIEKTYDFNFRNSNYLDVSPFIRDFLGFLGASVRVVYVRLTLSGEINGVVQADDVSEFFASEGYLYSDDGKPIVGGEMIDLTDTLESNCWYSGSSDVIYKLDDSDLRIPLFQPKPEFISNPSDDYDTLYGYFYNKGELVLDWELSFGFGSRDSVFATYLFSTYSPSTQTYSSYKDRVNSTQGTLEDSICLEKFFNEFSLQSIDKIVLSSNGINKVIEVKTIEECKYKPYRVTFVNRYGSDEDLWFFKRSTKTMNIERESYRNNSLDRIESSEGIKTMINFNVNAYEKIVLSSGFVDERMNESFKQMLLSEDLQLYDYDEDIYYNVNVVSSDFQYKTHVDDKLINYEIEFEFAHEVINNVG